MPETTASKSTRRKPAAKASTDSSSNSDQAKTKFAQAIEDAKAGAQAFGKEAQDRAGAYREQLREKTEDWQTQAKQYGEQAKAMASELANEGKTRTTGAITSLSKIVSDNASTIDDKFGVKYGDYARKAATSMQSAADKLDEKDLDQLGEDAREFVRKSPGLAIGMAAVAGFMVARMFRGSKD
jgi:hypothetical protein